MDQYLAKGYSYSRSANPTVRALEKKLTDLEGGADTICFGTGMAAINGLYLAYLNAGDHAVVSDVVYGGTYRLSTKIYSRFGVEFSFVDTADPSNVEKAIRKNTKLILTETPANPTLKLTDLAAVSVIARRHGILHAVDNTFLTPYCQRPLELGADLVIHSTTKYFDGHNATVGGAIVASTDEQAQAVRYIMNATGMIMSPQVAWLTLQGCKTLSVRMDRQAANALAIAHFLESHPRVARVNYPGLPPDYWALRDVVAIVSAGAKETSSAHGHTLAASSPLNDARIAWTSAALAMVRRAIAERSIDLLGPLLEQDALAMHGVMMTGSPSLLYWQPATLEVLHAVRRWRIQDGLPVYFTIDAGPNVHLICEESAEKEVIERIVQVPGVESILASGPGSAPIFLDEHLF
mgnify:CR=1 FL=1